MFKGIYTALATPFLSQENDKLQSFDIPKRYSYDFALCKSFDKYINTLNYNINNKNDVVKSSEDEDDITVNLNTFSILLKSQIEQEVDGVIVGGSTGEGWSLSKREYISMLKLAVNLTNNTKVKIIANCNGNMTKDVVENAKICSEIGVNNIMCVIPYYNKPSQNCIFHHFKNIHDEVPDVNIMLYSVPSRTGSDFETSTILKLSELPRIVSFKDSSSNITRILEIKERLDKNNMTVLCGNDNEFIPFSASGADGLVSVISNIIPEVIIKIYKAVCANDYTKALKLYRKTIMLSNALMLDTNPIMIKYALSYISNGYFANLMRMPLLSLNDKDKIDKINTAIELFKFDEQ